MKNTLRKILMSWQKRSSQEPDSLNIADKRFDNLDTSRSSLVREALYDEDEEYLVLNLNGTYYQYCQFPNSQWGDFSVASSYGKEYNATIKGKYDCREGGVPAYAR